MLSPLLYVWFAAVSGLCDTAPASNRYTGHSLPNEALQYSPVPSIFFQSEHIVFEVAAIEEMGCLANLLSILLEIGERFQGETKLRPSIQRVF